MKLSDKVSPQILKYKCVHAQSLQSCPALCNPVGYSLPVGTAEVPDVTGTCEAESREGTGQACKQGNPKKQEVSLESVVVSQRRIWKGLCLPQKVRPKGLWQEV